MYLKIRNRQSVNFSGPRKSRSQKRPSRRAAASWHVAKKQWGFLVDFMSLFGASEFDDLDFNPTTSYISYTFHDYMGLKWPNYDSWHRWSWFWISICFPCWINTSQIFRSLGFLWKFIKLKLPVSPRDTTKINDFKRLECESSGQSKLVCSKHMKPWDARIYVYIYIFIICVYKYKYIYTPRKRQNGYGRLPARICADIYIYMCVCVKYIYIYTHSGGWTWESFTGPTIMHHGWWLPIRREVGIVSSKSQVEWNGSTWYLRHLS
jgi:hypothetical protein